MQKGYLILENGQVFPGVRCGAPENAVGELVFTTGMTGYLETLTDPSYYGQIVMQTFPLIGNYGVIPADFESARSHVRAYVARRVFACCSHRRRRIFAWSCIILTAPLRRSEETQSAALPNMLTIKASCRRSG
ncbi:MAG: carbamoyl-phosphate synthase domain-containing protein [bacterium]|nr:carbamoyl-phosphate synthase domain-containing protein [bacterium]